MSTRITKVDLYNAVQRLNARFGFEPGSTEGTFCLQGAYGGWQLCRVRGAGIANVTNGFRSKREIYQTIHDIAYGASVLQDLQNPATN